jgi:hypothetical protein
MIIINGTIDCAEDVWIKEHRDVGKRSVARLVHWNGHTYYHPKFWPLRYNRTGYKVQTLDLTNPNASWVTNL